MHSRPRSTSMQVSCKFVNKAHVHVTIAVRVSLHIRDLFASFPAYASNQWTLTPPKSKMPRSRSHAVLPLRHHLPPLVRWRVAGARRDALCALLFRCSALVFEYQDMGLCAARQRPPPDRRSRRRRRAGGCSSPRRACAADAMARAAGRRARAVGLPRRLVRHVLGLHFPARDGPLALLLPGGAPRGGVWARPVESQFVAHGHHRASCVGRRADLAPRYVRANARISFCREVLLCNLRFLSVS